MHSLQINAQRLWDSLMETAGIGATAKGGICRLTLTDLDRQVRDWLKAQCQALGCKVTIDEVGNMFATRPGKNLTLPPIAIGSHLDTQPTGGKFDGPLGVLAGLEALRTLHDHSYTTNAPIELVNWTNEEGARFAPAMLASGVFAGVFTADYAYGRTDRDGKSFGEELQRIGYRGPEKAGGRKFAGMFELHIEQGPILEHEGQTIGIVQGAQGVRWYDVTVVGQDAHAGAMPMGLRKDALVGAARMIERINAIARDIPDAVGTVGLIENRPNSRNVIPGEVFFTVDFRHPDDKVLDAMEAKLRAALAEILPSLQLIYKEARIWASPPVKFSTERHRLRRWPRLRLYRPRGADHHDLRAEPRRHFAQRSRMDESRGLRGRRAGLAQCRVGIRPPFGFIPADGAMSALHLVEEPEQQRPPRSLARGTSTPHGDRHRALNLVHVETAGRIAVSDPSALYGAQFRGLLVIERSHKVLEVLVEEIVPDHPFEVIAKRLALCGRALGRNARRRDKFEQALALALIHVILIFRCTGPDRRDLAGGRLAFALGVSGD